ncbi:MAG: hypothetical protein GY779_04415 [Gammaproteobacteria bacterium]|nr:hypothetical protein [Gammaproteobacteria bacterium]
MDTKTFMDHLTIFLVFWIIVVTRAGADVGVVNSPRNCCVGIDDTGEMAYPDFRRIR